MELKTKVNAEPGKQDLTVTREFDLPVELIFKAHTDAELIEQWKGVKVVKMGGKKHTGFEAEVRDPQGNVIARTGGVIHDFVTDKKIVRTFEVEGAPFGVTLEIYNFEVLTDDTSRLNMHFIYESAEKRDQMMKMPVAENLDRSYGRLEELFRSK